jgi:hypothetical protein
MRVEVENDSDESRDADFIPSDDDDDENEMSVIGRPRPRPSPEVAEERHEIWQRFEGMVQFGMDSCVVNRRAATDALFAHNRDPQRAIEFLLQ